MSLALTLWCSDCVQILQENPELVIPRMSSFERLLSRADTYPFKDATYHGRASYLFHQSETLPVAALTASVDLHDFDDRAYWLRADPVQLMPDRDTLVLFPPDALNIAKDESESLIAAFNSHFESDRVFLEASSPERWYIRMAMPIDLHTTPLSEVAYRSLQEAMPTGNAAGYWRQLLNEVQMLFFTHPVNEARRNKGWPEINSLWLWGEGQLQPDKIQMRPQAYIGSQQPYLVGMAKHTQAQSYKPHKNYQAWWNLYSSQAEDSSKETLYHHLVERSLSCDPDQPVSNAKDSWEAFWSALETDWLAPIEQALKKKTLHSVLLDFGGGTQFYLEPSHLKRFWRRKKPLSYWFSVDQLS